MSVLSHVVEACTTSLGLRLDHHQQRGVGHGGPDQPGTCLVDGQPQVSDRVEVEVLEGADGGDQVRSTARFSSVAATRSSTDWAP